MGKMMCDMVISHIDEKDDKRIITLGFDGLGDEHSASVVIKESLVDNFFFCRNVGDKMRLVLLDECEFILE